MPAEFKHSSLGSSPACARRPDQTHLAGVAAKPGATALRVKAGHGLCNVAPAQVPVVVSTVDGFAAVSA